MQTTLLDIILNKADEICRHKAIKCMNSLSIFLAMQVVCENVGNLESSDIDKGEYDKLSQLIAQHLNVYKMPSLVEDGIADREWNRKFRIWLSMSKRSAVDTFKFIKPSLVELCSDSASHTSNNSFSKKENHHSDAPEAEKERNGSKESSISELVEKTIQLREYLLEHIVGQNYAVKSFADGYFEGEFNARIVKNRKGPKAVFLFAGSPGVGKTYLATEAAKALGIPNKRFDMSGYAEDGSAFDLTGADANYKSPEPGHLTGFVHDNPNALLIIDEVEKAHQKVINLFLQVLDAGVLYDNKYAQNISFKDTIIIFTTNAGRQLYKDGNTFDFSSVSKKVILDALEKDINPITNKPFFPQAICSRMAAGYVFMFNRLTASDLSIIAANKLIEQQESFTEEFGVKSSKCEDLATTILFSLGGNSDARRVTGAAKRFFANELFELFRLISAHKCLTNIEWKVDTQDADEKIKELYQLPDNTSFLFYGDVIDKNILWNGNGKMLMAHNIEDVRAILKENEVSFVAIDYRYRMMSKERLLNSEDVDSEGKDVFEEIKQFYPEIPLYIWEQPEYSYSREEFISLTSKGAKDILRIDFSDSDKTEEQINQLLIQLWQQQSLESLAVKHQVLSYETAQKMSESGEKAEIKIYNLKLSTAIDADEQNVVVSAEEKPNVHWKDIVVNQDARDELQYFQQYLKNPKDYLNKGAKAPKGILLYGPPGTGKTTLAKVMATESDVTFLSASADQFISKWAGEGPQSVHRVFSVARKYAPAILFIDEIDAIGCKRSGAEARDGKQEILNALLTEMDGFKVAKNKPVLVMAATNLGGNNGNTGALDPALVRRFDRSICIDLPDKESRIKLIKLLRKKNPIIKISDNMIDNLSERSIGMSPALIEGAINAAIREAIRTGTVVTDSIIDEAFEKYNNGEEKRWTSEELMKTARHEAGHAFISYYYGKTPSYLTIVARDNHGGYMLESGSENKGCFSKQDLLEKITVALGGRAAELLYYGNMEGLTTGPSGDLETATSIVYRMMCKYAMYEEIAHCAIPEKLYDLPEIQEFASEVIRNQLDAATKIIQSHKKMFDQLVEALMAKSHLNKKEIEEILINSEVTKEG